MSWMGCRPCLALIAAAMLAVPPPSRCRQNASNLQRGGAEASKAPNASGQNTPVLKVEVRVVLVDVIVTNKKGEPVTGLKKDAFTVLEDGAPQNLASFEEHQDVPHGELLQTAANSAASLPPNVYTTSQTVQPSDSVNVLLLDWLNTQPADQVYVRTQVIKYLKTVPPGTRLAIFALTPELRIVQGFTTETARLLAAINDRKAGATTKCVGLLATQSRKASDQELIEMMTKAQTAPVAINAVRDFQMNSTSQETGDRSTLTIAGLRELQHYLAAIPGRKNVFWFAGSFPISSFPGAGPGGGPIINFSGMLRQTADQFGPDRIAIYPISAAGMTEAAGLDPSRGLDRRARMTTANELAPNSSGPQQAAMEIIAKETGGAAFYNTNGLERQITNAVEDAAHYYTFSYSPTNAAPDGKFRAIQVKLAEGNYHLSYRRGYYTETEAQRAAVASQGKEVDPLLALMRFGMPDFDQIVYRVRVAPEQNQPAPGATRAGVNQDLSGPVTRYGVDFTIPVHALKLPDSEGEVRRGLVEIMLVAYEKNGAPLNLVTTTNEFKVPAKLYDSNQNVEIHAREEIDLPNREVYLRAGLYERASGNVGTMGIALSPPSALAASGK
jgi:VWFA-related protein